MTTSNLQVLLAHFDFGENSMVPRNAIWVDVDSVEQAAMKVEVYVDENCLGMRDWFGGIIRDGDKKAVAVVSLRGNVETVEQNAAFINNAKKLMSKK